MAKIVATTMMSPIGSTNWRIGFCALIFPYGSIMAKSPIVLMSTQASSIFSVAVIVSPTRSFLALVTCEDSNHDQQHECQGKEELYRCHGADIQCLEAV
jgi:hypothetical protein